MTGHSIDLHVNVEVFKLLFKALNVVFVSKTYDSFKQSSAERSLCHHSMALLARYSCEILTSLYLSVDDTVSEL